MTIFVEPGFPLMRSLRQGPLLRPLGIKHVIAQTADIEITPTGGRAVLVKNLLWSDIGKK